MKPNSKANRAILIQDPSLDLGDDVGKDRPVLVVPADEAELDKLLAIAEPLARVQPHELIVARLLTGESTIGNTAAALNARCAQLSAQARPAVFTTEDLARDTVRLATTYDVELVLLGLPHVEDELPNDLAGILDGSPADVALLSGSVDLALGDGVFVPFGGGDHDWAALELAAWLALGTNMPLRLVGTMADPRGERRDASRLLADASLSVQRVVGVETEPLLADPTAEALVAAVESATVVVVGISPRWRREGIGVVRRALVSDAAAPTLLVHRGPRPSALAPRESRTRFTWSLQA